jgi:hypothetical protein
MARPPNGDGAWAPTQAAGGDGGGDGQGGGAEQVNAAPRTDLRLRPLGGRGGEGGVSRPG